MDGAANERTGHVRTAVRGDNGADTDLPGGEQVRDGHNDAGSYEQNGRAEMSDVPSPELDGSASPARGFVSPMNGFVALPHGLVASPDGLHAPADGCAAPASVDDLRHLTPETRRMLEVASVMGASFTVYDVAEVLGHPAGWMLRAVGEAIDAAVVVPRGQSLGFRHESVRQLVYDSVPGAVRVALHRQIGALLLAGGGRAAAAAEHLGKGAQAGDKRSLAGLDEAGARIRTTAPQWSADLAMQALRLTDPSSVAHDDRVANAVDALTAAGRASEAVDLARNLLSRGDATAIPLGRVSVALSSISLLRGRSDEAIGHAEAILAARTMPADLGSSAQLVRLLALADQGGSAHLRKQVEECLAGGEEPTGDAAMAGALAALGAMSWDAGRPNEAVGFFDAAGRRAERMPKPRNPYPRLALAARQIALGRFADAEALITSSSHAIEEDAATLWSAAPPLLRARLHLARGRLDDAAMDATLGLERAEELGTVLVAPLGRAILASVAMLRGDLRAAATHVGHEAVSVAVAGDREAPPLDAGDADIPFAGDTLNGVRPVGAVETRPSTLIGAALYRWVDARLLEARDGQTALVEKDPQLYDNPAVLLPLILEVPAAGAWLTRVALAADDRDRAVAVVTAAEQLTAANPGLASLASAATHARGVLNRDTAGLLTAAEAHHDAWSGASAAEDAGAALVASSDRSGARGALEQAFTAYERIGAERDLARVRARLRAVGVRRCHWSHEARPVSGWASLTETERNVASLVAESLTNPQVAERMFLSRHTVDFHLRQIFRKLGIDSRVALTRMVLEQRMEERPPTSS